MARPMTQEEVRPHLAGRRGRLSSRLNLEMRARVVELERQLRRPLRVEIEGPLTDEESEEVVLARLMDEDNWIPAGKFLEEFKYLCGEKAR